jgi:hypothetical protein
MCDVENSEGAQTLYSDVIAVFSNVPWLEPGKAPQRFEGMTEEEQELCDGARAHTVAAVARAATGRQQVAAAAAAAAARKTALAARSSPSSSRIAPSGTPSPARDDHWDLCRNAKLEARRLREFMANQKCVPPRLDVEKEALKVAMSCHHASESLIKAEERGEKTVVRERLMVKLHQSIEKLRAAEEKLKAELTVRRAAARRSAAERLAAAAPENGQERERGDGEEGEGGDGEEGERGNGEEGNGEEGERRECEEDDDFNGGQYDFQDDDPDGSQVSKDDIMATQQGL